MALAWKAATADQSNWGSGFHLQPDGPSARQTECLPSLTVEEHLGEWISEFNLASILWNYVVSMSLYILSIIS